MGEVPLYIHPCCKLDAAWRRARLLTCRCWRTGVPHSQENTHPWEPTVGLCLEGHMGVLGGWACFCKCGTPVQGYRAYPVSGYRGTWLIRKRHPPWNRRRTIHVLSAGLVGLALKLHVALGGIAHRPLESLYSARTFRVGSKLTNSASRLGFWADVGMSAARPRSCSLSLGGTMPPATTAPLPARGRGRGLRAMQLPSPRGDGVQGYLAHKKTPPPLEPTEDHTCSRGSTVGS